MYFSFYEGLEVLKCGLKQYILRCCVYLLHGVTVSPALASVLTFTKKFRFGHMSFFFCFTWASILTSQVARLPSRDTNAASEISNCTSIVKYFLEEVTVMVYET